MRYVAVDCGKYDTKVSTCDEKGENFRRFKYRTKISKGTFDDDMLERQTYLVRIDGGEVYKVGFGATQEAELESSKKTEVHKICTLMGVAMAVGKSAEGEEISVVAGIPYQTCIIPEERLKYKDFILANESHTVEIKVSSDGPIYKISFSFKQRLVYPESIGVLYVYPQRFSDMAGIIDIGNLNINNTYCEGFEPKQEYSFTDELGGKILISGLSQQLTSELGSRCNEDIVARVLTKPYDQRFLIPRRSDESVSEKSKDIIDKYLIAHAEEIKRKCDAKKWSTNFMDLVAIGGTSKLLARELKIVFGDNLYIPPRPEFVNADGFLCRMCAKDNIEITTTVAEQLPAV